MRKMRQQTPGTGRDATLKNAACQGVTLREAEEYATHSRIEGEVQVKRTIEERAVATAEEFWDILSPQRSLFAPTHQAIFRGQAVASWSLTPSILRSPENKRGVWAADGTIASDMQVFKEWVYLKSFAEHCGSIGLSLPNDTSEFRDAYLSQDAPSGPGTAFRQTNLWPDPKLFELLALAQHHGLPTRLLDWSRRSYVAAYFAISSALSKTNRQSNDDRLAVWALDLTAAGHWNKLSTISVPGGNNANLAAQAGLFTLLRQEGVRGKQFMGETSVDSYFTNENTSLPIPLVKVTLPVSQAANALALCSLYGLTGATMFPDFYGAARAASDDMATAVHMEVPD
ncbi:FRG domain-containing protein [Acidisoma cladoniae]|jgi:hypothetical protein|uniref:FRG domain-containing protein n=1 Tax=Acidisoma cladoniae TaxID=3040935 RepID=UPI00254F38F5|nr:FRG domain-containing protein [Acidisoma sp. PAMC 29798]